MKERYFALSGRIRSELLELEQVVDRTLKAWQQVSRTADDFYVDVTALNLHGFYARVERLLKLIADGVDRTRPTGSDWHQARLRQMSADVPGIRPAILQVETRERLARYRGFRHVVRNVYTFSLDPDQIELLVAKLRLTMDAVAQELTKFADFLETVSNAEE